MKMEDNLSLKTNFDISSADTDMFGRLRLSSLVNMLIQSAIQSADSLGFGFSGLREKQLYWVLSRLTLEIYTPGKWKEEIEIETWPKKVEKILYIRDFFARNGAGEIIAKATSGWLAIDIETKRPKNININDIYNLSKLRDKNAIEDLPLKINPVETAVSNDIITTYFDYDINGHVTSTRYIDWMMDRIRISRHRDNYPKLLVINYLKETMPDENLRLAETKLDVNEYFFEGLNITSDMPAFRGKIRF